MSLDLVKRPVKAELVYRMRDALERELRTNIPPDDPARATRIHAGKYAGEISGITLVVHGDHPLGFDGGKHDQAAERVPASDFQQDKAWRLPVESIGGSRFDTLYGTVEIRMLKSVTTTRAVEIIETVKIRIARVVNDDPDLSPYVDKYGYRLFAVETADRYGYASGGDNTSVNSYWCDWIGRVSYRRRR